MASGRLKKELAEVGKVDTVSGVSASAIGDGSNLRRLKGKINGPESTCYEGGIFEIDIEIPKQYPFEPPKVRCLRGRQQNNTFQSCLAGSRIEEIGLESFLQDIRCQNH